MNIKRRRRPRLGPVSKYFLEAVKQIPEVEMIIMHYGDYPRIWTIIDAPRMERVVSGKIFGIQSQAYFQGEEDIDFRLVNLQEVSGGIAALHIEGMPVLYQKKQPAA